MIEFNKLTIIIPVYNEINTINILLKKVIEVGIDKQIIVVDDFSSDGTREIIIKNFENKILHPKSNTHNLDTIQLLCLGMYQNLSNSILAEKFERHKG